MRGWCNRGAAGAALAPSPSLQRALPAACGVQGARCPEDFAAAATRFAQQLVKYEDAAGPVVAVAQGRELPAFWASLAAAAGPASAGQRGGGSGEEAAAAPSSPRENPSYDKDFEVCLGLQAPPSGSSMPGLPKVLCA